MTFLLTPPSLRSEAQSGALCPLPATPPHSKVCNPVSPGAIVRPGPRSEWGQSPWASPLPQGEPHSAPRERCLGTGRGLSRANLGQQSP